MKIKHIISLSLLWTCQLALFGQARLGAGGDFNPANPGDPQAPVLKHELRLAAYPAGSGTFNVSESQRVSEGDSVRLYAYPNTGFVFRGWMQGDSVLSATSPYSYRMGTDDATVTAVFAYSPTNPSNPGRNHWDASTGNLIVDDFTPGRLSSAISEALGNDDESQITQLIISGELQSYDYGFTDYYSCTLIDLSRTYGWSSIPSYSFYNDSLLASVILPPTTERVEYYAFNSCESLTDITCYALVPPVVEEYAFSDIAEGAVLHVPAAAIPLYAEADGWKDFTILPLQDEVRNLEVSLPADAADGRYRDMTLELLNAETGQRQRYVISDRVVYTFNSLMKNSTFNVYVRNQAGTELGRIEGVAVGEDDVKVAFASLLQPRDVSLSLLTPDGVDVTAQATVTWLDSAGTYIKQGALLAGQLGGTRLACRVALPQALAMQYVQPADSVFTVAEGDNNIVCTLAPIGELAISGSVKDAATGQPISGAVVSVSQLLNGRYSKAFNVRTDATGAFTQTVFDAPTSITASASDYVSLTVDSVAFGEGGSVGELALRPITGVTVTTTLTYTGSVAEGETSETQDFYADYANVTYSIYNVTQGKAVTQFNVQYPQIVLLEEAAVGDVLRITASSKTSAFVPVVAEATIDEANRAAATFPIVELGGIRASFTSTDNAAVVGLLYGSNGQLIKKYSYNDAQLTISQLADGSYTLVTMANSSLFNSILNLSEFAASGLTDGSDYVQNAVEVKSGAIAVVSNETVPALDESKLYYTGGNTSFTVNKTSIVAGNYLTLKGRIDFKSEYASSVGDVCMVVDLPESCSFVENSVMVGTKVSSYTLDGSRFTIPMANYRDDVRFCVIPTDGGTYAPSAFASFTLGGENVLQPIGSASYEVKDLSISVPSTVAKTSIAISGTAIGNSNVKIYDNGVLIGETTALANGVWATTCELGESYNLSRHSIYAKVTTAQGVELQSEAKECIYDMTAIQVSKVIMYHDNPEVNNWQGKTYEIVFDFLNPTTEAQKYIYYIYNKKFTFTIDFTNNDTTLISNVVLYVKTGGGRQVPLKASFDSKKKLWVAAGEFGNMYDGDIPVNVSVSFDSFSGESILSYSMVEDANGTLGDAQSEITDANTRLEELRASLAEEWAKESPDMTVIDELNAEMYTLLGLGEVPDASETIPTDEEVEELQAELDRYFEENEPLTIDSLLSCSLDDIVQQIDADGMTGSISVTTCDAYDRLTLGSEFVRMATTEDTLYVKATETQVIMLDFNANLCYTVNIGDAVNAMGLPMARANTIETIQHYIAEITNYINSVQEKVKNIYGIIDEIIGQVDSRYAELSPMYGERWRRLEKLKRAEAAGESINRMQKLALEVMVESAETEITMIKKIKSTAEKLKVGIGSKVFGSLGLINTFVSCKNDLDKFVNLYFAVPSPCEDDQEEANSIRNSIVGVGVAAGIFYVGNIATDVLSITGLGPAVAAAPITAGASLGAAFAAIGKLALSCGLQWAYQQSSQRFFAQANARIASLQCKDEDDDEEDEDDDDNDDDRDDAHDSGSSDADPSIDPSGYVYEAVSSNRLEGVTATCYYKETVEDMYGDLHENVVLWDAAEYAQENPLFTDENGMYRWDVPQGLWQVKFEKDGYQTTYSDWLPVPPPQLEVNIAMVQNRQPEVKAARAYESGIEVEFDKYMQPETMTTDNIFATVGGEKVEGSITLMNAENAYEGEGNSYVSKVRFVPATPFLSTDEVVLSVSRKVKSYAGIQMESDYSQAFDIEKEVTSIVSDSIIKVAYSGEKTIRVSALPYDAAIGRKLVVRSSSPMIASVSADTLTLDENGQAELTLGGELPGAAVVTFALQGADLIGSSSVQVVDESQLYTAAPVASRASGSAVYRNTEIELSSETADAVIYYTTDGSCPCDEATRLVYDGPIAVTADMTIKAMAVGPGMDESEVAEFTYTIKTTTLGLDLNEGWTWVSHDLESPVAATELGDNALRIVSQTAELVNDPVYGLTGNLTELVPEQAYKVQASAATSHTLSGYEHNGALPIELKAGWNWIGYPVSQTMTLDEALANMTPDEEDYIAGQEGFAQFADGQWTGTLQTLTPGAGYMYHSQADKQLVYNTAIVSRAQALYGKGLQMRAPWAVDKYRYPNVMCLVADLYVDGTKADAGEYSVGAFCGTECRGIGTYVDGKLMMNIYGEGGEKITFMAVDNATEQAYTVSESEPFAETLLGSIRLPYRLNIGDVANGINTAETGISVWPAVVSDRLYVECNSETVDKVIITDLGGATRLVAADVVSGGAVNVSTLSEGVYVVTVRSGSDVFYKKIVKSGK